MARRSSPIHLVEHLENRLLLSSSVAAPIAGASSAGVQIAVLAPARRYRHDAVMTGQAGGQANCASSTFTKPALAEAQKFFQHIKGTLPEPSPAPTPTPQPPLPPGNTLPVTIAPQNEGNLTRLIITGTSGDDSISVSQSGSTITIQDNGNASSISGTFGELAIYGGDGNDTITVQSSVNITSLLYGGNGNNTLTAAGSAQSYIVSIGSNGVNTLTGNGINTAFWANPGDNIRASAAEIAGGDIHRVASFYQPFTTDASAANYVGTTLNGPNLADPTDSGTTVNLANRSLFGTAPAIEDVNQGQAADCYFLSSIDSFAAAIPDRLQQMAVDLGDGTYAVQFKRNGSTSYVRVDADLPVGPFNGLAYNAPKGAGPIWATIMEKAYAYFRSGANTWASLGWGWTGSVYSDFGVANTTFSASGNGTSLFNTITSALAASKAVSIISVGTIVDAPIIASHSYAILGTAVDVSGTMWFTLRNTWGVDGAGNDDTPNDGLVTITLSQLQTNFSAGSISI